MPCLPLGSPAPHNVLMPCKQFLVNIKYNLNCLHYHTFVHCKVKVHQTSQVNSTKTVFQLPERNLLSNQLQEDEMGASVTKFKNMYSRIKKVN
jgi:hypothetical protein